MCPLQTKNNWLITRFTHLVVRCDELIAILICCVFVMEHMNKDDFFMFNHQLLSKPQVTEFYSFANSNRKLRQVVRLHYRNLFGSLGLFYLAFSSKNGNWKIYMASLHWSRSLLFSWVFLRHSFSVNRIKGLRWMTEGLQSAKNWYPLSASSWSSYQISMI